MFTVDVKQQHTTNAQRYWVSENPQFTVQGKKPIQQSPQKTRSVISVSFFNNAGVLYTCITCKPEFDKLKKNPKVHIFETKYFFKIRGTGRATEVPNYCFSPFFYLFTYHGRKIKNSVFRWMDSLRFYVRFNGILVISGRWAGDNEKFCAMESRYD